jgi:transitional endoplasmic reticulum ATPase
MLSVYLTVKDLGGLGQLTMLLAFVVPFSYFGFHARLWYAEDKLKLVDLALQLLSATVSIALLLFCVGAAREGDHEQLRWALLHIAPLVLTFLIVVRHRGRSMTLTGDGSGKSGTGESDTGFDPRARNDDIEEVAWDDLIIGEQTKEELMSVITLLKHPENASKYGIALPKGILFNGPPGTGKTTIARAVATMAQLNFFVLRANDIVSKWVGDSEKNLSRLFETASKNAPAVIFIDEIDSIGKKRSGADAAPGDNLLNHLLQLIDGVIKTEGIYIIAATNRADLVDEALRRAGRLNRVIEIPLPDLDSRRKLFKVYSRKLKLADDIDLALLAKVTEGNSGADIKAICNQAGLHAYQREQKLAERQRTHIVSSQDVEAALEMFSIDEDKAAELEEKRDSGPQAINEKVEKLSWDDIVIDADLKTELQSVIELLKDPGTAKRYGITVPKGILLNGPPGTGKTTIAKVIANQAQLSFFAFQADEVVSKWVGESEKNLTRLFKTAAREAPSVIFIDEVDSIAKNRSEGNAQHADNLLNHLLQLIDGVVQREGVYVIAATNRADLVDPALKRGGRLNKTIQVPLPNIAARAKLFELYLGKLPIDGVINVDALARATEGRCAADIREICNQAGLNAFKRESARGSREYAVTPDDLGDALQEWLQVHGGAEPSR